MSFEPDLINEEIIARTRAWLDTQWEDFHDMDGHKVKVHSQRRCDGQEEGCPIHHPSDHEYAHLPLRWDPTLAMFVRVEPGGTEHIDPDSERWMKINEY